MSSRLTPWFLVVALGTLGVLGGHEIDYALTGTPSGALHGYMSHLPQVIVLFTLLSLLSASLVEREGRVAFWPFPAVALAGFVVQEHGERLVHSGSVPFLLDKPFFLVGLAVQALVAFALWLAARLLVRAVGTTAGRPRAFATPGVALGWTHQPRAGASLVATVRARSPPFGR